MRISITGLLVSALLCVAQDAAVAVGLPNENPNGVGDLLTFTDDYAPGHGIYTLGMVIGIQTANGIFSCFTFSCFDPGDAFFMRIPDGRAVTQVHVEALPGDVEIFKFEIEGSVTPLFDMSAPPSFDFFGVLGPGTYEVEIENGQQKLPGGVFVGVGSTGGAWRMDFTVVDAATVVPYRRPGS